MQITIFSRTTIIIVFDAEGKYIVKIPLFTNIQVFKKNRLYTIDENEDGIML